MNINKIESYFPKDELSNSDLYGDFPNYEPEKIENKIGIKNRHVISEKETALKGRSYSFTKTISGHNLSHISCPFFGV